MKITLSTTGLNFAKEFNSIVKSTKKQVRGKFSKQAAELMKKDVVDTIQIGNSPVKGFGRYQGYSESYSKAIAKGRYSRYNKKNRPVNLTLSGKMLSLIAARITSSGFKLVFTSKLAKYHNELGAGKARVIRRLYPKGNEVFKQSVVIRAKEFIIENTNKLLLSKLRRI